MNDTKILWKNPKSCAGISSLLFIIPAILHNNPIFYILTICSFLSDYIYIGKRSNWHIIDRSYSTCIISYIIYNNHYKLNYFIIKLLVNLSLCAIFFIHLFTKYTIKIQNKCLFDISHTIWHILGSFYFVIYYNLEYTYLTIQKLSCETNYNRMISTGFYYYIFWNLITLLFYNIGKNIYLLYPPIKSWVTPLSITRSLTALLKSIVLTLLISIYFNYYLFSPIKTIDSGYILVEISGYIFVSYELTDIIIGLLANNMEIIYVFHHIIHIVMGIYFLINGCQYFTIASYILSQEISGLFLNPLIILKNMDNNYINKKHILYIKYSFSTTFVIFRLILSPYATISYINSQNDDYIKYIITSLLVMGNSLQYYWAYKLIKYKNL